MEGSNETRTAPTTDRGTNRRRRFGVAGVIVFATGLIVGVIVAGLTGAGAQTTSSPSPGTQSSSLPSKGFGHEGFGHDGFGFGAIHGEFTTVAPGGGYQTLDTQIGTVSSVSSSSITVKSVDGFTRTYGVDDNTLVNAGNNGIADVKTGDTVRIVAVVSGGKSSAVEVIDGTNVQKLRGRWAPPFPGESNNSTSSSSG
jgi:hypothetical protein